MRQAVKDQKELVGIRQELEIAGRIQNSILPDKLPSIKGLEISIRYLPMKAVGGDYYDYHIRDENTVGIFVADVTGHGVPAALIAAMLKVAFSLQRNNMSSPAEVLAGINETLRGKYERQLLTGCYAYIDTQNKKLYFASAGHPPLLLWRKSEGRLFMLKPRGRIIGWLPKLNCEEYQLDLKSGDRIVMYTDGLTECRNPTGEILGENRFKSLIRHYDRLSADSFTNLAKNRIVEWHGGDESEGLDDDFTLAVMDVL